MRRPKITPSCCQRLCVFGVWLMITGFTGCSKPDDPVMAPGTPALDPIPTSEYPRIVLHGLLEKELVYDDPVEVAATGRSPMQIRVPLRSVSHKVEIIEYRFVFYGPQLEQTSTGAWHTVTLPPRTREIVTASALTLKAESWELEVRRQGSVIN